MRIGTYTLAGRRSFEVGLKGWMKACVCIEEGEGERVCCLHMHFRPCLDVASLIVFSSAHRFL